MRKIVTIVTTCVPPPGLSSWIVMQRSGRIRPMKPRISFVAGLACLCVLTLLGVPYSNSSTPPTKELLLFGGEGGTTFLGCLNCSITSETSICNPNGEFGSGEALASIWNDLGDYGSEASDHSPWSDASANPPMILDRNGDPYGYFTRNTTHRSRTRIPWLQVALEYYGKTKNLEKTRVEMCSLSHQ